MSNEHEKSPSSSVEVFIALSIAAAVISILSGFQYQYSEPLAFITAGGVAAVAFGLCAIALALVNIAQSRDK